MTPATTPSIYRADLFEGKGIIVTGGGTGLGFAISRELASLGAKVVIAARNLERLEDAARELNSLGKGRVWACRCNVRSEEDIQALVSFALETMGRVDGLVNNAGGQFVSQVEDISAKGFKAVLETNLLSTFMLSKEVFKRYMSAHGGSIVNITVANGNGFPMMAHSGAARAGVENLAKSMALEWVGSGVRVNCVAPGIIYTESGFANYGPMGETFLANLLPGIPCKRCGTAEEVSTAVVWLLSEASVYVTGQTIGVDGGIGQTHIPLRQHEGGATLMPSYGELNPKAKL